jgi:hypothetical protein
VSKELTPAEYKFAAEQMAACLLNGVGVCARFKERVSPARAQHYELDGWMKEARELVNRFYGESASHTQSFSGFNKE